MGPHTILLIEDDRVLVDGIRGVFEGLDVAILSALDGRAGLEAIRSERPDLVVLDVKLPLLDGYSVLSQIRTHSDLSVRETPVIMLTGSPDDVRGFEEGADDFIVKPASLDIIKARILARLRRVWRPPYKASNERTVTVACEAGGAAELVVAGDMTLSQKGAHPLDLQVGALDRRLRNAFQTDDWRFELKELGRHLFKTVFHSDSVFLSQFKSVLGNDGLGLTRLRIKGKRELLTAPFEAMYDDTAHPSPDYVVRVMPMARVITGVACPPPFNRQFLNNLSEMRAPLNVLLIASNTEPPIPGVDREIESLRQSLDAMFRQTGIQVNVTVLTSEEATYSRVCKSLESGGFNIIHYAGHGSYHAHSPEQSALYFWKDAGKKGGILPLTAADLRERLRNSRARFLYLSCCFGSTTGAPTSLLEDDFLGLLDAAIHAGIPSALGFRRPVSDHSATTLAVHFYASLAKFGEIDIALMHARRHLNRDDEAWFTPILVVQE